MTMPPQDSPEDRLLPTRRSLIDRLAHWDDHASWQEFFHTYWKFIYGVAIRSGLGDQEAEEVVQETIISIAKKMPQFVYDPAKCTFKGWLMHVIRLRIMDQLRKRQPPFQQLAQGDNDSNLTPTVERLPDTCFAAQQDTVWAEEWERNLLEAAIERAKLRVKPEHYQIFHLSAVKGMAPREIARLLQIGVAQVYVVRHRVGRTVQREIARLRDQPM